jgi:sulfate/thiosulfate transport system substrate-binding protein
MRHRKTATLTGVLSATVLALTACAGGASDTVGAAAGQDAAGGAKGTVSIYAYSVPKAGFDKVVPAYGKTTEGKGVTFQQSFGASGDQSRKVVAGAPADFVLLSLEPDVTRLVDAGLVDPSWNAGEHKGMAMGSVVTMVVRKGNPKGLKDWDDLLKPGIEVVTPNPFSSGGAKWNLLAPYAVKSQGGKDAAAGLAYVEKLVTGHVKVQPKSAREATETFLQGTGDVLLSYEAEALFAERAGDPVEHVTPPQTFKIENPIAVIKTSKNAKAAQAFHDYQFTPEAQELWAQAGFRPVDQAVAAKHAADFPPAEKLWTIADLGGWKTVDGTLFKKETGSIAAIYDKATS